MPEVQSKALRGYDNSHIPGKPRDESSLQELSLLFKIVAGG
jgi:hypothetical protein